MPLRPNGRAWARKIGKRGSILVGRVRYGSPLVSIAQPGPCREPISALLRPVRFVAIPSRSALARMRFSKAPGHGLKDFAPRCLAVTPLWFCIGLEVAFMDMTVMVKSIPDEIYGSLNAAAQARHRSLNSEVIACQEHVLMPTRTSNNTHLALAAQMREERWRRTFDIAEIVTAIDEGWPWSSWIPTSWPISTASRN